MVVIYFAGGEDSDFINVGGNTINTSSKYRTAFARCALGAQSGGNYWESTPQFSASVFWCSFRVNGTSSVSSSGHLFQLISSDGKARLRGDSPGNLSLPSTVTVRKVDASGSATSLGTYTQTVPVSASNSTTKFDIFVNYSASGQLSIYQDGVVIFDTGTGVDITTNSITALAGIRLDGLGISNWVMSEIIISDTDTRSLSLQTLAPSTNGNTHNFDVGSPTATNVNETTVNDTTLDGSSIAGQIDQYTIPVIAGGTFSILSLGVASRAQKGLTSGPSKMDLGVRISSADYWSSDITLTTSWAIYSNWWALDPSTSASWTALPDNIGVKSVT